jgi:hypothetical protein
MSVLSPKRAILFVAATLLAFPLFAAYPSPRLSPRLAFVENAGVGILFGGRGLVDPATSLEHATDETWQWNRNHWVQLFPEVRPPARSAHTMVYDSQRHRVVVFGGRKESTVIRQKFGLHSDTWEGVFENGEWVWRDLAPAAAPEGRFFQGMAYDRDRDRVLLYGGFNYGSDGKLAALFDTWEFDGENWTRVAQNGPQVSKPLLVFDAGRSQTLLLGTDTSAKPVMFRWNQDAARWDSVTAATLPTCVNEAQFVYQVHNGRPLVTGGLCGGSGFVDDTFEWDGTTWTKITPVRGGSTSREVDAAMAYDTAAQVTVRFGGHNSITAVPDAQTYVYRNNRWRRVANNSNPAPRSMPLFRRDAERGVSWLFGGLTEYSYSTTVDYYDDIWAYSNGNWSLMAPDIITNTPFSCETPIGAMDTDRSVLVVVCEGDTVFEWNGTAWKTFNSLSVQPAKRRFAGGVYDQTLKKFVMFGGYDQLNTYRQDTWTWNGQAWTEVKPNTKPEHRAQPVMWYDPLAKKTILYSGAGSKSFEEHAKRFTDMWSFDGTNWTRMTETAAPGIRFAPQIAIDPSTNKLLMFGGLRATLDEDDRVTQFYDNDLWIWDGASSTWTEVQTEGVTPLARQNAGFEYDIASGKFVLFGGFSGNMYLSDRWTWDGQTWTPIPDEPSFRRRSARR